MPRSARIDRSQLSEFANLMLDWTWDQRPPLTIAQFAADLGIAKTTVWGWFREGRLPDPKTLGRIAKHTGIPLGTLYTACGYPIPALVPEPADPFDAVVASIERNPRFSPAAKAAMIARVREVQSGDLAAPGERYIAQEMTAEGSSSPQPGGHQRQAIEAIEAISGTDEAGRAHGQRRTSLRPTSGSGKSRLMGKVPDQSAR